MSKINNGIQRIKSNPFDLINILSVRGYFNWMPDALYLKLIYFATLNKKLNLKEPQLFNEKLQWLKLHNRNPKYTMLVDKYEVRKFVTSEVGEQYLNTSYGVWDSFDEIDFEKLPNKFVLKTTHDSGGVVICSDKNELNLKEARKKIENSLKRNFYYVGREWPYKNVKPRIIAEEFLSEVDGDELRDYRFFCFGGEPKFAVVDFNINDKSKTKRNIYDLNWKLIDAEISYPNNHNLELEKPKKYDEMISLSKMLSKDIPFSRIDFFYINDQIIFGEITFFHKNGLAKITPESFEKNMGDLIVLPNKY